MCVWCVCEYNNGAFLQLAIDVITDEMKSVKHTETGYEERRRSDKEIEIKKQIK